uniref:Aldo_ket_red domain-containing protein n=1 Tax=Macrostomum lignano TaxID=282301 RepID=A0A1I8FPK1_9PLAT
SVAEDILTLAYACAFNFFDTAEVYAAGRAELLLGRLLAKGRLAPLLLHRVHQDFLGRQGGDGARPVPQSTSWRACRPACSGCSWTMWTLCSPTGRTRSPPWRRSCAPSASASTAAGPSTGHLARLGLSSVFSTFIFLFDVLDIVERHPPHRQLVSHGDHGGALGGAAVQPDPPVAEQVEYHMFQREKLELQMPELFAKLGLGAVVWSPLACGILSGKYDDGVPVYSRASLKGSAVPAFCTYSGYSWLRDKILSEEGRQQQRQSSGARRGGDHLTARWPAGHRLVRAERPRQLRAAGARLGRAAVREHLRPAGGAKLTAATHGRDRPDSGCGCGAGGMAMGFLGVSMEPWSIF